MPFYNLFTPVVIMKAIEKGPDYASWWFACVWPQMSSSIGGVSLVYYYVVVHSKAAVKHTGLFSNYLFSFLQFTVFTQCCRCHVIISTPKTGNTLLIFCAYACASVAVHV